MSTPDPLGSQPVDPFGDPEMSNPLAGMPTPEAPPAAAPAAPAATAAPEPPQDPQAKAQALAQQKVNSLMERAETLLSFDVTKDPDVAGELSNYKGDRALERDKMKSLLDDYSSFVKLSQPPPTPPDPTKDVAPEMRDFTSKTTPWLMILSAVGGKVAGLSGLNMIGAMNGMLKGTIAGQEKMFDQSYQKWQDNWKRLNEDYRNRTALWEAQTSWRKGQIDAEARAAESVATMAGEDLNGASKMAQLKGTHDKAMASLAMANTRLGLMRESMDEKKRMDWLKIFNTYTKVGAGFPRNTGAKTAVDRAYALAPTVFRQWIADTNNGPTSPVPKSIAQWMISTTASPEAKALANELRDAKVMIMALETQGTGARSNMLLQMATFNAIPSELYNRGVEEVDRLLRDNKAILDIAWKTQEQNMNTIKSLSAAAGFPLPDEPAYTFPASSLPADRQSEDDKARGSESQKLYDQADAIIGGKSH